MAILAANQIIQIMKLRDEHKVSIVAEFVYSRWLLC